MLPRPRHPLAAVGAVLLVAATLCGCSVASVAPAGVGRTVAPLEPAALRHEGARVVEDDAAGSLVVRPKRPNGGLVVFLHGWGQNRWAVLSGEKEGAVVDALGRAGFTVLAADANGKAWGDPASIRAYETAIATTQRRYGLRDVFLMGESMGGLATMQLGRRLPDVRAVTAWFPVCDLRTMRGGRFESTIRAAWSGRSAAAVSPVGVGDAPMLVWASAADTVVRAATNTAVCVAEARRAGAEVAWFHTTGEHGDPSNFDPATVVAFFDRHLTPGV